MNIESKEFKEWFGKSKVIGKDKKPLSVYHGTVGDFEEFLTNPLQKNSVNGIGENAIGSCFSESKEHAACYPFMNRENKPRKVMEVHLSIKSPKKYRSLRSVAKDMLAFYEENDISYALGGAGLRLKNVAIFKQHLMDQGYDGITYLEGPPYNNKKDKERVWVAFHPEQIQIIQEYEGENI